MKYLLVLCFVLTSCVSPQVATLSKDQEVKVNNPIEIIIEDKQPSFDGNEQNSGILDFVKGEGWLITDNALKRYNLLIGKFGKEFTPSLNSNFGVTIKDNKNYLSNEAMVKFALMNQKNKLK